MQLRARLYCQPLLFLFTCNVLGELTYSHASTIVLKLTIHGISLSLRSLQPSVHKAFSFSLLHSLSPQMHPPSERIKSAIEQKVLLNKNNASQTFVVAVLAHAVHYNETLFVCLLLLTRVTLAIYILLSTRKKKMVWSGACKVNHMERDTKKGAMRMSGNSDRTKERQAV